MAEFVGIVIEPGKPMLRRILILLGETPSSLVARRYAFQLAREMDVELAGLAGVDLSYIEAPMPGTVGTMAYKARLEQTLIRQAGDARERLREAYEQECKDRSIPFEWLSFDGDPVASLQLAAEVRDLLITGHDTAFYGNIHQQLSETLVRMLLVSARPVIVCGDEIGASRDIMIAYDGSVAAMRAVQMFTLLGLGRGRRIHVTSIDADKELSARRVGGATGYLQSHGCHVEGIPIASGVHPAEVLAIEVADRKIGTLVMGAYGHRGFREFLFGSTTSRLVENPRCALFLYH